MTGNMTNSDLTAMQRKAIIAMAESPSLVRAADEIGCSVRSLHRWLNDPSFVAEMQLMQQAVMEQSTNDLVQLQGKALHKIGWLMDHSQDEKITLSAAAEILRHYERWYELSQLNAKLDRLESLILGDDKVIEQN